MRLAAFLFPAALLLIAGCQPSAQAPVYGPWEEGLTLAYEDPSQPQPRRSNDRLQVRVNRSEIAPGAPRLVQLQLTSLQGQTTVTVRHQDGGIALLDEDGRPAAQSLPVGFPATAAWTERGTQFRVLGRATWEGAALLPATSDPVGIWVEARPAQGPLRRTLYLPNLGEVESLEQRENAWVTVNRLVARGFIDLPSAPRP
jgi:hypothetical protein